MEKKLLRISTIIFIGIVIFNHSPLKSQETDPFYHKLLSEGERSFLSRNYDEAIKELEIAAFGLHREKELLGKAYIYLSLCHYYLKDIEKSKDYLSKTVSIMREEEFGSLGIHQSAWKDFYELLDYFKLGTGGKKEELHKAPQRPQLTKTTIKPSEEKSLKVRPPAQKPEIKVPEKKSAEVSVKDIEKKIKQEPQNISLYYQLYNFYRRERNVKDAKKLLETLVENNPNEINAFYLLAKIEFSQKLYQNALKNFNELLKPSDETQVDNEILLKSMIYISACLFRLNQKQHLESFVNLIEESTSRDQLIKMLKEEGLEKDWGEIKRVKS